MSPHYGILFLGISAFRGRDRNESLESAVGPSGSRNGDHILCVGHTWSGIAGTRRMGLLCKKGVPYAWLCFAGHSLLSCSEQPPGHNTLSVLFSLHSGMRLCRLGRISSEFYPRTQSVSPGRLHRRDWSGYWAIILVLDTYTQKKEFRSQNSEVSDRS